MLTQGHLQFFSILGGLIANIAFQVEVEGRMKNAMLECRSPSDFWGKKWNPIVQKTVKVVKTEIYCYVFFTL